MTVGMTRAPCGRSGGEIQPTELGLGGEPRQYADPTGRKREPPVGESGPRGAMTGGLEGHSGTGWHWPGSMLAPKRQLSTWEGQRDVVQKTWRLLTTPGVSAMTRSDLKSKLITDWVKGHTLCRTREVTDLLGSEQLKAPEGNWVHWGGEVAGTQCVCTGERAWSQGFPRNG